MKVTPLLMKGPLVLASIRGDKTQTRRTKGLEEVNASPDDWRLVDVRRFLLEDCIFLGNSKAKKHEGKFGAFFRRISTDEPLFIPCPYGGPGDLIWIKETWAPAPGWHIAYRADLPNSQGFWKSPLHMRREYSRLTLHLSEVRAQRLQDISVQDVRAEGVEVREFWLYGSNAKSRQEIAALAFKPLWESINGKGAWSRNDWVWPLTYKAIPKNINSVVDELKGLELITNLELCEG